METFEIFNVPVFNLEGIGQLLFRFFFNAVFIWIIIHIFYYRKNKKVNYYFTFSLISVSVFFLIYMLGGVKMKIGMALGLFAIFGIIRYRTEVISVREMTYLFVIITLSVINAMAIKLSYSELFLANVIFVLAVWVFEGSNRLKHVSCKYILWDRVDLIKPSQYNELLAEVKERTGLDIINIEVGAINYLQDTVMLKVFYELQAGEVNSVDNRMKLPRAEE